MARTRKNIHVRLLLETKDESKVLLLKQTKSNGGRFSVVGGKVDRGELAKQAIIREAKEEIGVDLVSKKIKLKHVLHLRRSTGLEIILFFRVKKWKGEIKSMEPEKFVRAQWVNVANVTRKRMPQWLRHVFRELKAGSYYSELEL